VLSGFVNSGKPDTIAPPGSGKTSFNNRDKLYASPCTMVAVGYRPRNRRQKSSSNSTKTRRPASTPRATRASVTGPVPGPSSMIGPLIRGSTTRAMACARTLPDGSTAPIGPGFSSQVRKNRTRSKRLCSRSAPGQGVCCGTAFDCFSCNGQPQVGLPTPLEGGALVWFAMCLNFLSFRRSVDQLELRPVRTGHRLIAGGPGIRL
jgi:hypothetical protein